MALSAHWQVSAQALSAAVELPDFVAVQGLVHELLALAERLDHHPEVSFGYRRVSVVWTTHDAGGVTVRDAEAAAETDRLFARFSAR